MTDRDIFLSANPPPDVTALVQAKKTLRDAWPHTSSSMRAWALCNAHAFGALTDLRMASMLLDMLQPYRSHMTPTVADAFEAFRAWYDGTMDDADSLLFQASAARDAAVSNREERITGVAVAHCLTAAASDDKTPFRAAATLLSLAVEVPWPEAMTIDDLCATLGLNPDADLSEPPPVEAPVTEEPQP